MIGPTEEKLETVNEECTYRIGIVGIAPLCFVEVWYEPGMHVPVPTGTGTCTVPVVHLQSFTVATSTSQQWLYALCVNSPVHDEVTSSGVFKSAFHGSVFGSEQMHVTTRQHANAQMLAESLNRR